MRAFIGTVSAVVLINSAAWAEFKQGEELNLPSDCAQSYVENLTRVDGPILYEGDGHLSQVLTLKHGEKVSASVNVFDCKTNMFGTHVYMQREDLRSELRLGQKLIESARTVGATISIQKFIAYQPERKSNLTLSEPISKNATAVKCACQLVLEGTK